MLGAGNNFRNALAFAPYLQGMLAFYNICTFAKPSYSSKMKGCKSEQ